MDEHAQRAPVDDQPGYESPKLRWGEYIYFEHGDRMRANGPVEETVDAKLWDYGSILVKMLLFHPVLQYCENVTFVGYLKDRFMNTHTFSPNSFPEGFCKGSLIGVILLLLKRCVLKP